MISKGMKIGLRTYLLKPRRGSAKPEQELLIYNDCRLACEKTTSTPGGAWDGAIRGAACKPYVDRLMIPEAFPRSRRPKLSRTAHGSKLPGKCEFTR